MVVRSVILKREVEVAVVQIVNAVHFNVLVFRAPAVFGDEGNLLDLSIFDLFLDEFLHWKQALFGF